jgi:hypothetical protein
MGLNTSVQQFLKRLNDLNRYLLYFPEENPKQLDQYEIIEILDQAKPMLLSSMKQWRMPTLTFLKCLMRNLCVISSVRELGEDQTHQRSQSFLTTIR